MGNDLDKPLGQHGPRKSRRRRLLSARGAAAALAVVAVVGLSTYLALLPEPLQSSAAPDTQVAAGAAKAPTASQSGESSGEADTAADVSAARLPGASGADIRRETTDDGQTVTTFRPGTRDGAGPLVIDGGAPGQDLRVAHIPDPALIEDSAFGPLPVRGPEGKTAMHTYARGWSGARGPRIAIIVGGLGLSQTGSQYAIRQLPEEVTLGFAATGNSLQRWMQAARREGHEIVLQVPMEPFGSAGAELGPEALSVAASPEENIENLHRLMAEITNYTGVMNYMGGRFMADPDAIEPVLRDIEQRGLLFVDDGTSAQSQAETVARTIGLPYVVATSVIDSTRSHASIMKELDALERTAVRNGVAVGVASAFEVSVEAIAEWVAEASARNIEIVGVSALVADDGH